MIAATWIAAAAASLAYAGVLALSADAARGAAPVFLAVVCAAWLVLTIHHNRRNR